MYDWLEEHKEINRSLVFRNAIQLLKSPPKKNVSSLVFLAATMGIVFSIVLIGISTTQYLTFEFRSVIALLGGVLAITTSFVYYKERRRVKCHTTDQK